MSNRVTLIALVVAVAAAGGYALLRPHAPPAEAPPAPTALKPATPGPHDGLPPGHPPINASGAPAQAQVRPPSADEGPTLTWSAPDGWVTAPNPNSMRLATFKIPHTGKDTEDAELSVSRAGGGTEANLQRWVGQFEEAGKDTRATRTIQGLSVTTVEVSGVYLGGMMGGAAAKKPGWSLLGAIVETPGSSYFFKMVGPTATVQSARPAFNKLLDSITVKK